MPSAKVGGQVLVRCPACGESSPFGDLKGAVMVCPWCDFHFPLGAGPRVDLLVDPGSFRPLDPTRSGPALFGQATLHGRPLALAVGDPAAPWAETETGALITLTENARLDRVPLLWVVSFLQGTGDDVRWPGVQAALSQLGEEGLWVALLTGPCYGAQAALALQAGLVLAEPGAVVSPLLPAALREAGRLPAESTRPPRHLLREGWADAVLPRRHQRTSLSLALSYFGADEARPQFTPSPPPEVRSDPWRPLAVLDALFDSFFELHGDRRDEDDPALVGGLARLREDGPRVLVLVTAQGEGWREVRRRHGGAIGIGGWRKADRLLRLAARFGLPVVTLVGTPELRFGRRDRPTALATALGETMRALLDLPVPTVAVHLDHGGGLAALALSATDRILARETLSDKLQPEGIPVDATFARRKDLLSTLGRHLGELTQTYAVHGPLGRRKLIQHRRIRWTRLPPSPESDQAPEDTAG